MLLFTPKPEWGLSQSSLFLWMVVCTTLTRVGMTLFEVPHRSFGAEITKDYLREHCFFHGGKWLHGWLQLVMHFLVILFFSVQLPSIPMVN